MASAAIALAQSHEISLQLAGAQLGVTMASLGLGAVAEPAIGHLIGSGLEAIGLPEGAVGTVEFVAALTIVVFLHMVIGEMVPKNLALAGPERTMCVLAWPNRLYVAIFRPVIRLLNGLADLGARLFGFRAASEAEAVHSPEDIAAMVASSREEGLIEPFEHELLVGALDLEQREIVEVMVPAADVAWVVGRGVGRRAGAGDRRQRPLAAAGRRTRPRRVARLRARQGPARRRRRGARPAVARRAPPRGARRERRRAPGRGPAPDAGASAGTSRVVVDDAGRRAGAS